MSATDELLTLLKEYELEHYEHEAPAADCVAFFDGERWHDCWESVGEEINVTFSMTPEQAIDAALGPGTCKLTRASWDDGTCTWGCICSACDAHLEHETGIGCNFCPICGAKVVDE